MIKYDNLYTLLNDINNLVYYLTTKKIQFGLLTKYSQVLKYSKIELLCKKVVYDLVY